MNDGPRTAPIRPVGLTCRELVELVTDYLEDALGAGDRARFEAHLRACEGCSAYLGQMRSTIWATRHLCERTRRRPRSTRCSKRCATGSGATARTREPRV